MNNQSHDYPKTEYTLKPWYVVLVSIFLFTIIFQKNKAFTYVYYYVLPTLILARNYYSTKSILRYFTGKGVYILFCLFLVAGVSIIIPFLRETYDFSFVAGPMARVIKQGFAMLFLVLVYLHAVSKKPNALEFSQYIINAVILYVIVSLLICFIPSLHEWMLNHLYFSEQQKNLAMTYYFRIGWHGFSNYDQTFYCTFAIVLCFTNIMVYAKQKSVCLRFFLKMFVLLIGNMLYGRIGFFVSVFVLLFTIGFLFLNRGLAYPFFILLVLSLTLIALIVILRPRVAFINNWFLWTKSIIDYLTGNSSVGSLGELNAQYESITLTWRTLLFGDARYTDGDRYYRHIDIGLFRNIYYFGLPMTIISYIPLLIAIRQFTTILHPLTKKGRASVLFVLLFLGILFELKGEISMKYFIALLPFLLSQYRVYPMEAYK